MTDWAIIWAPVSMSPCGPYMRGTRCWIAHSAAVLRNVPHAHLATGYVHAVPIYPLGMA